MALSLSLRIALKEWATVCAALETGRQIILLRKGGIRESGGEFELEKREFLLFPTYLHQNLKMLKPDAQGGYEPHSAEPAQVRLSAAGVVTDILQIESREQMDALDARHIWTAPLIDMRFNYRPENPLYLLLVRAYALPHATTVDNTPAYAGCKSWVPLDRPIDMSGATPVLNEAQYAEVRSDILATVNANV